MAGQGAVAFRRDSADQVSTSEPATWALGELEAALRRRGVEIVEGGKLETTIIVTSAGSADAARVAKASGIALPGVAESFALLREGKDIFAIGYDERGLVYALTELADRVDHAGDDLFGPLPFAEAPATKVRSITRLFVNEREDKGWFHDKSHWIGYLTMLASNRFNRFSLTLGIQYDYPYHNHIISDVYLHFPYPYLVDLPQHGIRVVELPDAERATNLEMLKFIGREAKRRGLDFQLGLWTQRYDFDDVPNANYAVVGATEANIAPYCRDAVATILREVPEITGLTFRIHVEGGVSEGDYDFWRTVFAGVKSAGRPIEIDMHAKGLDEPTIQVALDSGMPVAVSPKYLAEHIGLPYHPSAIREREYPPKTEMTNREKLSVGTRRFTRQSYGDFLPAGKRWKVIFRVWPGTQRVLAWGDPALAAGYGRNASFAGADGIEWMEPMAMKGRQGTGIDGGRIAYKRVDLATRLDWQKYAYQFRLWGRSSYNPGTDRGAFSRYLARECGDAAGLVGDALHAASSILPLITQAHGPSIANNGYWPEIYTNLAIVGDNPKRPYGFDMDEPTRFGNAPTFDPQMFATAREYATALLKGETIRSYTPLDVADWLDDAAETAELSATRAKRCRDIQRPGAQRLVIDALAAAAIGRFFAAKFRGACWGEVFIATQNHQARERTIDYLKRARSAWIDAVNLTRDVYQEDLTFGPGPHLRGAWASRLADIDREVKDLIAYREREHVKPDFDASAAERAMQGLDQRTPVASLGTGSFESVQAFDQGKPLTIAATLGSGAVKAVLHYRHINQAERWQTIAMTANGTAHSAVIPAEYTATPFHLQYYISMEAGGGIRIAPGFAPDLANQPYAVVLNAKGS
jgi:hypothetical protein